MLCSPYISVFQLRVYPQGFADKINSLLPKLMIGGEGSLILMTCPKVVPMSLSPSPGQLGRRHTSFPAYDIFGECVIGCTCWMDGSFPKPFEILHKMECRAKGDHEEKITPPRFLQKNHLWNYKMLIDIKLAIVFTNFTFFGKKMISIWT